MIYVVEGIDRCGKTSFIDILRSKITNPKILVIHSAKPPKNVDPKSWSIEYYDQLISRAIFLSEEGFDVILDRAWLGEMVYGPIYRNTNISLNRIEEQLFSFEDIFKLFLFIDSPENALSREDGNSISDKIEHKRQEIESFINAFNGSTVLDKTLVDWSNTEFNNDFLNKLADKAIENEQN